MVLVLLPLEIVGIGRGSVQFEVRDPGFRQQPVGVQVRADAVVPPDQPGVSHLVGIRPVVQAAQVPGHAHGQAQRHLSRELSAPGHRELVAVVGGVRGHRVGNGTGALQAGIQHAPAVAAGGAAQIEALAHGDLLGARVGGHRHGPGGLAAAGIDLDDAGGHVAVLHGRHAGNHFDRFDIRGCDALRGHAQIMAGIVHVVERSVAGQAHAVHLDGRTEGGIVGFGLAGADAQLAAAGQVRFHRGTARQQAGDVGNVHQLHVVQRHAVDRAGGGGGVGVFLRGDDRALQGKVVRNELDAEIDILAEFHIARPGHIAQAVHPDDRFSHGDIAQHEFAFGIGHGPLLGGFHDHGGEADGIPAAPLGHGAAEGHALRAHA